MYFMSYDLLTRVSMAIDLYLCLMTPNEIIAVRWMD